MRQRSGMRIRRSVVMDARAQKFRKLNAIRYSGPHVSASALANLCSLANQDELPTISRRGDVRRARDLELEGDTPYGPLLVNLRLQLSKGGESLIEVANPLPYLYRAGQCFHYGRLLKRTFEQFPCSADRPWSLAIYSDEAKTGNKLKQDNKLSMQCCYAAFLEFGPAALAKEDYWLTLATCKSSAISQCDHGMAQLTKALLKLFFNPGGHDLRLSGVSVDLEDGSTIRILGLTPTTPLERGWRRWRKGRNRRGGGGGGGG
eukprot:2801472-Pyramimonas_sp.AAC.1